MSQDKPLEFLPPLGRYGRDRLYSAKYAVLAIGLAAMAALTVPGIRAPWLEATLWACQAFFAAEVSCTYCNEV